MSPKSSFIFLDPSGKRWSRLKLILLTAGLLLIVAIVSFIRSLWIQPELQLPAKVRDLKKALKPYESPMTDYQPMQLWTEFSKSAPEYSSRQKNLRQKLQVNSPRPKEIHLGFYVDWDPNSLQSLKNNQDTLTHVTAELFSLRGLYGEVTEEPQPKLQDYLESKGIALIPMLSNLSGDEWVPEAVESLFATNPQRRLFFLNQITEMLSQFQNEGLLIDFQKVDPVYKHEMTALLKELSTRLHAKGKKLWLMVPVGYELRTFDLDALAPAVDYFVATLHDENSETDLPGPVSSQNWFDGWIRVLLGYGDPEQWIVALGNYGYDWTIGKEKAETIGFVDAMSRASASHVQKVVCRAPTFNNFFSYQDEQTKHEVWFLDAITFYNQLKISRSYGVGGAALYRLGTEDPHVWNLWKKEAQDLAQLDPSTLNEIQEEALLSDVGQGEVITVDLEKRAGKRDVKYGTNGRLESSYSVFPRYPTIYHEGADFPNKVALTFDDGPDSKWTPKILEVLKEKKVKATFFVVGNKVEGNPEVLLQIFQEGHEIGSHSYSHSNLRLAPQEQITLELNATQRLIESVIDHSTILFRPPYQADARPKSLDDLTAIAIAQEMKYITICENIDPQDWARPGADVILRRIKDQRHSGNIILLHDAGGDRSQTLEALPRIIDYLRARGDEIVPLSDLLQIPREQLMAPVKEDHHENYRRVSSWGFRLTHAIEETAWAFMILATGLLLSRTLFVAWLAYRHDSRLKSKGSLPANSTSPVPVSILVPAHNEEKVIERTLLSLVQSEYPGKVEILVIDDGSRDQTGAVVSSLSQKHPEIRLITQTNSGKSHALQNGIQQAAHEILILLDADTQFEKTTVSALVSHFEDPLVAAVSGQVKVGNTRNFLTKCQALEYTCGFNLDRRAYDDLNAITVVPGAVCALRKKTVIEAGGLSHDTLAEDTDLTLTLHRMGNKIRYAPDAIAWTEAPESLKNLVKQRLRWSFGTMQCLWKHRDLLFNLQHGWLGWFSLPSIWFFQVVLVAIVPIVDLLLIFSLLLGNGSAVLPFLFLFLGVDLFLALMASRIENEPIKRSILILPMRLFYRPLLAYVVWKSIYRAVQGALMGWSRIERQGSVTKTS